MFYKMILHVLVIFHKNIIRKKNMEGKEKEEGRGRKVSVRSYESFMSQNKSELKGRADCNLEVLASSAGIILPLSS